MYPRINKTNNNGLKTTETFIGESLEEKVRRVETSNEPIESISPMLYTERKDGVLKETNIRTDRFDIALHAMDQIHTGTRTKRAERMKKSETQSPEDVQK